MNLLVCISSVPDTTTRIKYKEGNKEVDFSGVQFIINPWDELALTRAIELKESGSNVQKITIITVGKAEVEPIMRKALASGADEAIRVDAHPADAYSTAAMLAQAIKGESFDLVLCGVESSDYNSWSVGGMLAEFLELPSISSVSSLNIEGDKVAITREIDGGKQQMTTSLPAVLIVQKGIAIIPRIPSMRGIMTARTKPLKVVQADSTESLTGVKEYQAPPQRTSCKMIDPDNMDELAHLLHTEARVI